MVPNFCLIQRLMTLQTRQSFTIRSANTSLFHLIPLLSSFLFHNGRQVVVTIFHRLLVEIKLESEKVPLESKMLCKCKLFLLLLLARITHSADALKISSLHRTIEMYTFIFRRKSFGIISIIFVQSLVGIYRVQQHLVAIWQRLRDNWSRQEDIQIFILQSEVLEIH